MKEVALMMKKNKIASTMVDLLIKNEIIKAIVIIKFSILLEMILN
jgi:hypothetical protein